MERRLILLRHAKSSWKSGASGDHDRPLSKRGRRDAPRVAAYLEELGWVPELVVSSTSKRTRQTWQRMERELRIDPSNVHYEEDLYHGGLAEVRASARGWPPNVETVMVIGHNPGWEDALYALSHRELVMTTGNAALLRGRGETWDEALHRPWELAQLLRPRELP